MRRIISLVLVIALCFGSVGFGSVFATETVWNPSQDQWVKFSEKIKRNKISPYLSQKRSSGMIEVIAETRIDELYQSKMVNNSFRSVQKKQLDQVQRKLSKVSSGVKVKDRFRNIFTGFTLSVPVADLEKIANVSEITSVYPVITYRTQGLASATMGAKKVWGMKDRKGVSVTGKGVKVGIVDTGVDYKHPDLKKNYKGGYNVVGKNKNPMDGNGHGTHVAGIIAANGRIKGIAPNASIYAYRVLNNRGIGTNSMVLKGIEKAIEDKVDVINLSLGSNVNTPDDPLINALNKAVKLGITVVVANGNSGSQNWTVGTPATAEGVISVGASSLPSEGYKLKVSPKVGETTEIDVEYETKIKVPEGTKWELVDVGYGGSIEDYKGKNVRGKMVFVKSGMVDPAIYIANAEKMGATAILSDALYLPDSMKKSKLAIFSGMLDQNALKKAMKPNPSRPFIFTLEKTKKDEEIASFSSRGMVQGTWAVKPDLVAPGVQIKSTVPKGKYDTYSGTSMASPQVAGAAALLKQKHPTWKPREIKAALSTTAKDLVDPETNKSYPVKTQGAGRVDISRAIKTTSIITPNNLSFGMIKPKSGSVEVEKTITIKNVSKSARTYQTLVELVNGNKGTKVNVPSRIRVSGSRTKVVTMKLTIDSSMKRSIYTGRLYLKQGINQFIVPFTFCIDPRTYSRINYLSASKDAISPKSKKKKGSTELSYFIPNEVKYVTMYVSGEKLKPTIIHQAKNVTSGWKKFKWDGTIKGKPVSDGVYTLSAVAKDGVNQDSTELTMFIYRTAPKLKATVDKKEAKIKLQVRHELAILGYFLSSLFGAKDLVKVQYQLEGSKKWTSLPLKISKLRKRADSYDLSGRVEFNFMLPYSWMKGDKKKVTIRATDESGNRSQVKVEIPKDVKSKRKVVVSSTSANIRKAPSKDAAVIQKKKKGESISLIRTGKRWYKVRIDGKVGYIHQSVAIKVD